VPDSGTVEGVTGSLVASVRASVTGPSVVGLNVTESVRLVFGVSVNAAVGGIVNCEPVGKDTLVT
jgi:hypothetical protein